jgi:hypothetical protein
LTRLIFRVESAPSTAHVHEPSGHKRNCDEKAEEEVDENGVVPRAAIEKDICEGSEHEDNQRPAAASEQNFALPMSRQNTTNTALQGNPRSGKL